MSSERATHSLTEAGGAAHPSRFLSSQADAASMAIHANPINMISYKFRQEPSHITISEHTRVMLNTTAEKA